MISSRVLPLHVLKDYAILQRQVELDEAGRMRSEQREYWSAGEMESSCSDRTEREESVQR